ncbi:MAG TPA: hypothetical protein P5545_00490 [Bacteroidota bacterium]|nr:hypothetical protein [Bacteroidota bacterium]
MEISEDTQKIIDFLQFVSENNLRKSNDLAIILEIGATYDQFEIIKSLIFMGKSFWNLSKILSRSSDSFQLDNLKREFEVSLVEIKILLSQLLDFAEDSEYKKFNVAYFKNDIGATRNLIDLAHDLSILKDIQKNS